MDMTPYIDNLRGDLTAAAAPAGEDTVRAAEMLGRSLEPSARLALLEALTDAAAEITTRLSDTSVEVRLRGREADFVVTTAAITPPEPPSLPAAPAPSDAGDLSRITLRIPESLKTHVEQLAAAENISVNAWLVRAVAAAVNTPAGQRPGTSGTSPTRSGKRLTGYFQA
jgi:hypothetical protein